MVKLSATEQSKLYQNALISIFTTKFQVKFLYPKFIN